MANGKLVKVWDPLVRIVHWALVATFFTAYFTGEDAPPLHEWMGYIVLGLVILRIVWGFVGSGHARFSDFVRGPGEVLRNLRDIVLMHPKRYLGHSPAGGAMVVLLLVMLAATTVTGIIGEEQHEQAAPAAIAATDANGDEQESNHNGEGRGEESPFVEAHEVLANLTLALVLLHIAGVILASFAHRENLVASMFTGRKRP
jgi:cytochrome b